MWVETSVLWRESIYQSVMPRKRHVSRNSKKFLLHHWRELSCLARGMWVETYHSGRISCHFDVMPRKRHVSRNVNLQYIHHQIPSCLARGMWVETDDGRPERENMTTSCLARGMWVETSMRLQNRSRNMSCLARGMWVETRSVIIPILGSVVMPRKRHVSRNIHPKRKHQCILSCLARGMWVETVLQIKLPGGWLSCLARGMWVETFHSLSPVYV